MLPLLLLACEGDDPGAPCPEPSCPDDVLFEALALDREGDEGLWQPLPTDLPVGAYDFGGLRRGVAVRATTSRRDAEACSLWWVLDRHEAAEGEADAEWSGMITEIGDPCRCLVSEDHQVLELQASEPRELDAPHVLTVLMACPPSPPAVHSWVIRIQPEDI